jgi:hypothetical protein
VTDGLDQLLADAGLNLLRADSGLVVYDGAVPNPVPPAPPIPPPYVVVYTTIGHPDDQTVTGLNAIVKRAIVRWTCHCVGGTAQASRAVAQRVRTALLNVRPTVAGMNTGLIKDDQDSPPDPVRDETTGVVVIDTIHVYTLLATT